MIDTQQIEISFHGMLDFRPGLRRQRRLTRARWWFSQMRRVVDHAIDPHPAPAPRPQQTHLGLGRPRW